VTKDLRLPVISPNLNCPFANTQGEIIIKQSCYKIGDSQALP